jgi:hypothetical protein
MPPLSPHSKRESSFSKYLRGGWAGVEVVVVVVVVVVRRACYGRQSGLQGRSQADPSSAAPALCGAVKRTLAPPAARSQCAGAARPQL